MALLTIQAIQQVGSVSEGELKSAAVFLADGFAGTGNQPVFNLKRSHPT
jgi:hypothetical protein